MELVLTPHEEPKKPGKPQDLNLRELPVERFAAGQFIFHEGDPPGPLYIVQKGRVKLFKTENGAEKTLGRIGDNAIFGEMAGVDGHPRSASALAEVDTDCYVVDTAIYTKHLDGLHPFMRGLFRVLVECLRHTTEMQMKK